MDTQTWSTMTTTTRNKMLPNKLLQLSACLLRGRRCRPLAARTAAAEYHVSAPAKAGKRQQVNGDRE